MDTIIKLALISALWFSNHPLPNWGPPMPPPPPKPRPEFVEAVRKEAAKKLENERERTGGLLNWAWLRPR